MTVATSLSLHKPLTGPSVWTGAELERSDRWRFPLTPAMVEEIDGAVRAVARRGLDWESMRREDFPLPLTAPLLARMSEELENGTGAAKLSGLPVAHHDDANLRRLWYGLGLHLGQPVTQSHGGLRMKVIRDEGADTGSRHGQFVNADGSVFLGSYSRAVSNAQLRFHTDRTDVVGLLCAGQAAEGGLSKVASSPAVHNEILRRRPDLLELLFQPYPRSRLGEEKGGEDQHYMLPIFGLRDGKFTSHYSRTFIEAAEKMPGVPRLSAAQWEAIDLLHEVADQLCYRMRLEVGDVQFLNNHVIYHARESFLDDPARGMVRRLYRLWLTVPNSRALPEDHAVLWREVRAGAPRGGIAVAAE
jgi:hypothetical protein